jgi:hypothetical protein
MTYGEPMRDNVWPEGDEFSRLDLYTRGFQPPAARFRDLRATVTAHISAHLLPFEVRTDFIRATGQTVLTPITIQLANRDVQFQNKDGVMHGVLDIYARVTSLNGRIVNTVEKSLIWDMPEGAFEEYKNHKSVYQQAILLGPGRYKLSLVLKDALAGHMGSEELDIVVPNLAAYSDKLTYSSLILADQILPIPTNKVASGPFVIGRWKVRPSVNHIFTRDQKLGIYMQAYNLSIDDQTHKPSLDVHYEIVKDGKVLIEQREDAAHLKKASQQFTAATTMPLQALTPGKYTVQIKVTDNIKKQSVTPSATFELR